MRIIFGLVGVKGSGKNTVASFIREKYPFVREVALADKLKNVCAEVTGLPRYTFDAPIYKERYTNGPTFPGGFRPDDPIVLNRNQVAFILDSFGFAPTDELVSPHVGKTLYTPRQVAQYVGTEILRNASPNVHCEGLLADLPSDGTFIVTDLRFPNEYNFFSRRYPGHFHAFYISNTKAEEKASSDPHPSEKYIQDMAKDCTVVFNESSLEQLRNNAVGTFDALTAGYSVEELRGEKK